MHTPEPTQRGEYTSTFFVILRPCPMYRNTKPLSYSSRTEFMRKHHSTTPNMFLCEMQWCDIENNKRDIFFSTASRPRAAEGSTRIGMKHNTLCDLYIKWPAHVDYLFTIHRQAHLVTSVFPTIKQNSRKPKEIIIVFQTIQVQQKRNDR